MLALLFSENKCPRLCPDFATMRGEQVLWEAALGLCGVAIAFT